MMHKGESVAALVEAHLATTGKTQVAMESETGISDSHIARIRAGGLPGKWTLAPLARALGLSTARLSQLVDRERAARLVGGGRKRSGVAGRGVHGRLARSQSRPAGAA